MYVTFGSNSLDSRKFIFPFNDSSDDEIGSSSRASSSESDKIGASPCTSRL